MRNWVIRVIGVLIIANVVLVFWPSNNSVPGHVHPHKVDVNANVLRLNKEVEMAYREQQQAQADKVLAGISDVSGGSPGSSNVGQCYRLGPFSLESNFAIAQATLLNAGLAVDSSVREVTRTEVYRVFMGPFAERAQAIDMRTTLNNRGVLDHFIRQEPSKSYIVSLGIFTTQAAAEQSSQAFKARIEGVKQREELVTLPESYWLYFRLDDAAVLRDDLDAVDWGEVGAQIGPFACRDSSE